MQGGSRDRQARGCQAVGLGHELHLAHTRAKGQGPASWDVLLPIFSLILQERCWTDYFLLVQLEKKNDFIFLCIGWPLNNRPLAQLSMGKGFI